MRLSSGKIRSMLLPIVTIVLVVETVAFTFLGLYCSTYLDSAIHAQLISKIRIPGKLLINNQIHYNSFKDIQFLSELTGEKVVESMIIKEDTIFYSYLPELEGKNSSEFFEQSGLLDLVNTERGMQESKHKVVREGTLSYLSVLTPLYQGNIDIGTAYIKIDLSELEKNTKAIENAFMLISLLCIGLTTLLLTLFIRSRVIKPLSNMVTASKKIAAGDLSGLLTIKYKDELGGLAQSFNRMTSQLRSYYQDLENKVRERTKEVEETKRQLEVKLKEVEKMNTLIVGRELKMIQLKKEIKELKSKLSIS